MTKRTPIRSADFDTRLSLRRHATGQDAIGQPLTAWTEVTKLWANVKHLSGLATIKAGAESSVVKASIRIRYTTAVVAEMRLVNEADGTVYKVLSLLPNKREGYIDLPCEVVK